MKRPHAHVMDDHGNQPQAKRTHTSQPISSWTLARRPWLSPTASRASRALTGKRSRRLATVAAVLLSLLVQAVLLWLAGELVDLYVSAVELWAELARKHLEITLS